MTPHLHGPSDRPVVLVIGTWDPFCDEIERALTEQALDADRKGYDVAAVLFDPAPATFLSDEPWYPFVSDRYARIEQVRATGVASVLAVDFEPVDIQGTAADFFDIVGDHYDLAHVLLGPSQTLGRADRGNRRTIDRIGRERGFRVWTWKREADSNRDLLVRKALHRGAVAEAADLLGRPPLLSAAGAVHRAEAGTPWTWPCGTYHAVEVESPVSFTSTGRPVRFELQGGDRAKRAVWSHDIGDRHVAVLRGPADAVARPNRLAVPALAA